MNFGTEKKGYNSEEVDAFINRLRREYEGVLSDQKARINELKSKLKQAEDALGEYKAKAGMVSKAIYNAVQKADEIEKLTKIRYNQEIAQLKSFHDKWMDYYHKLLKKYPLDDDLIATDKFNKSMSQILLRADTDTLRREEDARVAQRTLSQAPMYDINHDKLKDDLGQQVFNPINKIKDYLQSDTTPQHNEDYKAGSNTIPQHDKDYKDRSNSGFSFAEALNPKEDLSEIMRDLGLLLEDDI